MDFKNYHALHCVRAVIDVFSFGSFPCCRCGFVRARVGTFLVRRRDEMVWYARANSEGVSLKSWLGLLEGNWVIEGDISFDAGRASNSTISTTVVKVGGSCSEREMVTRREKEDEGQ